MPKNSNFFYNPGKKIEDTRRAVKRDHPDAYNIAEKILPVIIEFIAKALDTYARVLIPSAKTLNSVAN